MAFNVKKHDKVIDKALIEIQDNIFDNVKALENQVADIVAQELTPEQTRPQIMQAFETHSTEARSSAAPLTNISSDILEQSSIPTESADIQSQSTLLNVSEDQISTAMTSGGEDVVKTIVLGTVAGIGTQALINQVRGRISGINMESNDPNVRKAQRQLRKMMKTGGYTAAEYASVKNRIKRALPGNVNTAASVGTRMSTVVDSVVQTFNSTFAKARAKRNNIETFEYVGPIGPTSRPFCQGMVGSIMNEEEINGVWDSESWAGKEPGDPFVVAGGYNCRHYWNPIEP